MRNTDTFRQYIWIVRTIQRANRVSYDEIKRLWLDNDLNDGRPLSRTTFYRIRQAIDDIFGIRIECNCQHQYYITNPETLNDNSTQNWMLQTLTVGNTLADCLSIKERLVLEEIPEGTEYLQAIIKAIKSNHRLTMTHHSFYASEAKNMLIEPYCLKLFRQRWYLLGKTAPQYNELRIYALDRVTSLEETNQTFTLDPDFQAEDFFRHYFGTFIGKEPIRIVLRAYGMMIPLLRTLPKHHTQKEIATTELYSDFEYFMAPTFDFRQEILREGSELEVLEPIAFRKELTTELKKSLKQYRQ